MVPVAGRIVAEGLGTAFLLAAVVGSGVMAARLAGSDYTSWWDLRSRRGRLAPAA